MVSKNTPLRWGILGFGGFSDVAMAPAIAHTPGHRLAAIWGRDPQRTQAYAQKYEGARSAPSAEALMQSKDLDAVYIAAPNFQHADLTERAAERGLHVLCEKPMATSLEEAGRMIEACRRNGVRLAIGNMMRFNPCHAWIRDFITGGGLGAPTEAQGKFGYDLPAFFPLATSPWRLESRLSGGGALMDVGVHTIDLLRWLLGQEVSEVSALIDTRTHPFPIDWSSAAVLRFNGGAIASVSSSFDNRFRDNDLTISGTLGSLHAVGTLWRQSRGGVRAVTERGIFTFEPATATPDPYVLQIEDFAACVSAGRDPLVSGEEGLRDLEVCLGAYEAARTGTAIRLR